MKINLFKCIHWVATLVGLFLVFIGITFLINGEYKIQFIAALIIGIIISYFSIKKLVKRLRSNRLVLKSGLIFLAISGIAYLLLQFPIFKMGPIPVNAFVIAPWYVTALAIISYSFLGIGIILIAIYILREIYFKLTKIKNLK